jgi:ABC-type transporter Mla MlaB component
MGHGGGPQSDERRMAVTLERPDGQTRVVLSGPLSVREARTLHATLREIRSSEALVVVDDRGVAGVDTSAIQLLVAFARARRQAGLALEVTDGALVAALRRLGMQQELASFDLPHTAKEPGRE